MKRFLIKLLETLGDMAGEMFGLLFLMCFLIPMSLVFTGAFQFYEWREKHCASQ